MKNTVLTIISDSIARLANGRFMTVTFTKKDGTTRTINGRTGVKHYGDVSPIRMDSTGNQFLLIWSVRDRGFRRVNMNAIQRISAEGRVIYSNV